VTEEPCDGGCDWFSDGQNSRCDWSNQRHRLPRRRCGNGSNLGGDWGSDGGDSGGDGFQQVGQSVRQGRRVLHHGCGDFSDGGFHSMSDSSQQHFKMCHRSSCCWYLLVVVYCWLRFVNHDLRDVNFLVEDCLVVCGFVVNNLLRYFWLKMGLDHNFLVGNHFDHWFSSFVHWFCSFVDWLQNFVDWLQNFVD